MDDSVQEGRNRLGISRSPYLLQHASNPVDWYEWGESAFDEARRRDVPIFLSIGYSTCHWCHVMARESFENEAIAARMNDGFVNVKVDREERPDVDRIYMAFVQSTTGSGGWPMSVWLTPDLKPFYGGTYFPPDDRYGRMGFPALLTRISELWSDRREELIQQGDRFTQTLASHRSSSEDGNGPFDWEIPNRCLEELVRDFDEQWGGFGGAPKFPMPSYLAFLLEIADAQGLDAGKRELIGYSLDRMSDGGIRDFLAGGFHRYSVDRYWHVPHFEKMLYDQGQIAGNLAESSRLLGRIDDLAAATEIVAYVGEALRSPDGGLYSAEDADSPLPDQPDKSGEGAFYVWSASELQESLETESYALIKAHFGVKEDGNARSESDPHGDFKQLNVLMRQGSLARSAEQAGVNANEAGPLLKAAMLDLKALRAKRPRPHLDDKILSSWNGFMISGACKAYQSGGGEASLELAARAGGFLFERLYDEGSQTLYRSYRIDRGETEGFAEDYASAALAFIDLYESTGDASWLERSERLLRTLIDRFWDNESGGFFSTAEGDASLIARLKDDYDGAEPSANSLAALALQKLGSILDDEELSDFARRTIEAFRYQWSRAPRSMPLMLVGMLRELRPMQQIVIVSDHEEDGGQRLRAIAFQKRSLHSAVIYLSSRNDWLRSRNERLAAFASSDRATAYVCDRYACQEPVTDPEELAKQLQGD